MAHGARKIQRGSTFLHSKEIEIVDSDAAYNFDKSYRMPLPYEFSNS
jgi:hypothetical protein